MRHTLTRLLDAPALMAAMLVDAAIVGTALVITAPGPIEKAAMVLLSMVIVLFSVRGWVLGTRMGKALWCCFALASFFIDLSFALVSTDVQSVATQDAELDRLTAKVDQAEAQTKALQDQYDAAGTRATMDQLAEQIKMAEAKADAYRKTRQDRLSAVESGQSKVITSSALSTAIWDACASGKPGRITWLIVFGLIFAGIQLTMVAAATATFTNVHTKEEKVSTSPEHAYKRARFAHDDISRWVSTEWTYVRNKRGDAPVKRESFERVAKGRFDMALWDKLMAKAVDCGLIAGGKIVEKDQKKALEKLLQNI